MFACLRALCGGDCVLAAAPGPRHHLTVVPLVGVARLHVALAVGRVEREVTAPVILLTPRLAADGVVCREVVQIVPVVVANADLEAILRLLEHLRAVCLARHQASLEQLDGPTHSVAPESDKSQTM